MESLEYYKLKDELSDLIRGEITKSLSNERDLQQRYISVGLKVAATGLAAAVLALGVFGIKSFYEVDTAIKKIPDIINKRVNDEVVDRFNNNNPVAQYELTLLESAARSVATTMSVQNRGGNFLLDARVSDLITRALNEKTIKQSTKLSLIGALSTQKLRNVSPSIDQAVLAVVQQIGSQTTVDESDLRRCIEYFSYRGPERFVGEVEKIYDAHNGSPEIRLAIGRYASALQRDTGNLVKKLEKSEDLNLKYLLHFRELKNGKAKQVNREIFHAMLAQAINPRGDGITLSDMIDHIDEIDEETGIEIAGQMVDAISEYARFKNLFLAVQDESSDDPSFRLYTEDGAKASVSMDKSEFDTLSRLATSWIGDNLKHSKGQFTDPIKQAMDFWFPRFDSDGKVTARKAGGFILGDVRKTRFVAPDGREIPGDNLANRAIVTIKRIGDEITVQLKWTDEVGETKSMPIKAIVDLDPDNLRQYGVWRRSSNN